MTGHDTLRRLVHGCASSGTGRHVALLRTDLLPPGMSRPHHVRLARAALDPLHATCRTQTHDLPGLGVAVSWRGDGSAPMARATATLHHLLGGVTVLHVYDLPGDGPALLAAIASAAPTADAPAPLPPMTPAVLALLEDRLRTANVARFARRRPVRRWEAGGFTPAWERRVLSVAEIGAALAPGHDLRADPWLFRCLTRTLDRRMLALLSGPAELRGAEPFSLALNVCSILSPEFARFDAALPSALRGHVVLELCPADVLADPSAFAFAREYARTRVHRLLLRGVDGALLPALSLGAFGLDYLELRHAPNLPTPDPAMACVLRGGGAGALAWGQAHGIALYAAH